MNPIRLPGAWPNQFIAFAAAEGIRTGWLDRAFHRFSRYRLLEKWVEEKLRERTCDLESAWSSAPELLPLARKVSKILEDALWGFPVVVIPEDEYRLVGKFLTGDLEEIEALMAIEEEFDIQLGSPTSFPDSMTVSDLLQKIASRSVATPTQQG